MVHAQIAALGPCPGVLDRLSHPVAGDVPAVGHLALSLRCVRSLRGANAGHILDRQLRLFQCSGLGPRRLHPGRRDAADVRLARAAGRCTAAVVRPLTLAGGAGLRPVGRERLRPLHAAAATTCRQLRPSARHPREEGLRPGVGRARGAVQVGRRPLVRSICRHDRLQVGADLRLQSGRHGVDAAGVPVQAGWHRQAARVDAPGAFRTARLAVVVRAVGHVPGADRAPRVARELCHPLAGGLAGRRRADGEWRQPRGRAAEVRAPESVGLPPLLVRHSGA
mmetsp:Transcript_49879/g.143571  ORF Transcript_49879/g.143571 Transcript_49879/m.143571 type:complete len:280 (+) Transcript_49879:920-1759(+)